jgi:hypothetical protein
MDTYNCNNILLPETNMVNNILINIDTDNKFNEAIITPVINLKSILTNPVPDPKESTIKGFVRVCVGFLVCIIALAIVIVLIV